jgi:hypothetical protein
LAQQVIKGDYEAGDRIVVDVREDVFIFGKK